MASGSASDRHSQYAAFSGSLSGWDQLVFAEVLNPDFGGDEKFITRHAALFDSLTNGSFVFIDLRRINAR
jgi:hypothetical protein